MILRVALLVAALVAAGCSAPSAESEPPPLAPVPSADLGALLQSARDRVLAAVDEQRSALGAVRTAQESVRRMVNHVGSSLDGMQAWIDTEDLDLPAGTMTTLRQRAAALLEQADAVAERVAAVEAEYDAFEARALDELDGLERAPRQTGAAARVDERVDDLLERARALGDRAAPVIAASDALVLAAARLADDGEAQRDEVRRLLSIKHQVPMKSILRDPANDVELTRAPGFDPAEPSPGGDEAAAAAASAAAAWNRQQVAEIVTDEGSLVVEFFPEVAPRHVENFVHLVRRDFYDGLRFHRVVPAFVAQAGCPIGDGSGGPGYEIENEFNDRPHRRGTLSMARMGHPDSAGSQFFLCLKELPDLDGRYTVFGQLIAGHEVLDRIEDLGTISGTPVEPILIQDVVLRERSAEERAAAGDG